MRAWKQLGIVKTIDEEKEYGFSSSSPSLSPTDLSSPPTPDLHTRVQAWSLARGQKTDILVRVHGRCFHLHKGYSGKISDDLQAQICNSIDCNKLSPQLLLEAVQNPIMPLRFIVRAMLMEQLNTRRSIFISSTAADHIQPCRQRTRSSSKDDGPITLGAILQREAALRQAAHLKAAMDATSSRIESLDKELNVMKKLLNEPDILQRSILMGSGRSSSFHYGSKNKIERGERGSASSASLRCHVRSGEKAVGGSSSWDKGSCNNVGSTPKNIRRRLINGLKSAFWISKSPSTNGIESRKSSMSRSMDRKGSGDHG
ncbi:hypothetical protein I3760_01G004900 [Carya illinoinensis]|nr:hypothetical protein I3760_01G004900 [Carya illinoinensis]